MGRDKDEPLKISWCVCFLPHTFGGFHSMCHLLNCELFKSSTWCNVQTVHIKNNRVWRYVSKHHQNWNCDKFVRLSGRGKMVGGTQEAYEDIILRHDSFNMPMHLKYADNCFLNLISSIPFLSASSKLCLMFAIFNNIEPLLDSPWNPTQIFAGIVSLQ